MTKSSTFAKSLAAAVAALVALGAAASASAQPGPGYSNYDPCQRDANNRSVTGGLLGAAGGAVVGSQLAASGHRRDGSLLGGLVGAIAGATIGHSTAACNSAPPPPPGEGAPPPPPGPQAYYDQAPPQGPGPGPQSYYDQAPPPPPGPQGYYDQAPPPPPAYGSGYYAPPPPPAYGERDAVWVYGRHGIRFRVRMDQIGPDGCTVAESPIYLPDGRIDQRFVHVCPDYRGRFHIVG